MDFSQQLHRAEQLAKTGSLVMLASVLEPEPRAPWGDYNGGSPRDLFRDWFKPVPKLAEVWVDLDMNYLDVDRVQSRSHWFNETFTTPVMPQPSDRVTIEFTGTLAPGAYVSPAVAAQLDKAASTPIERPAPRVPDVYIPDGIAILSALLCGCTDQVDVWQSVLDELKRLNTPFEEKTEEQYVPKPGQWFLANVLDKAGLTEHGGNLCAAWLTYDGEQALEFLETNGVMWWDTLDADDVNEAGMRYKWDYDRREQ